MLGGLEIAIIGYSITSHWNNEHATIFRGLVRELNLLGNRVFFLEYKQPDHAIHRDLYRSLYCEIGLYKSTEALFEQFVDVVASADLVLLGSGVHEVDRVGNWLLDKAKGMRLFYDLEPTATLQAFNAGHANHLCPDLLSQFDAYLSGAGGPLLLELESRYGVQRAVPFFPSIDPYLFYRQEIQPSFDLGYAGNYRPDQWETLRQLFVEAAEANTNGKYRIVGKGYPEEWEWPNNITRSVELPRGGWLDYYNHLRFWLDVPIPSVQQYGYAPSLRLLEAMACGRPVISAGWPGIEQFFEPGQALFLAQTAEQVLHIMHGTSQEFRNEVATQARARLLERHTTAQRARELLDVFTGGAKAS